MSRLIEGRAGEFVTASAHLALNVRFARLVTCRGQTQMRADIPRATKAVRPIDRGTKGERGDGSHTWNAHESPADLLLAGDKRRYGHYGANQFAHAINVSFDRFRPWKSASALRPPPAGGSPCQ